MSMLARPLSVPRSVEGVQVARRDFAWSENRDVTTSALGAANKAALQKRPGLSPGLPALRERQGSDEQNLPASVVNRLKRSPSVEPTKAARACTR